MIKQGSTELLEGRSSWQQYLSTLPWAGHIFGNDLVSYESAGFDTYFEALNMLASVELNDYGATERKRLLNSAVHLLLTVYEETEISTPVSFSLSRALQMNGNRQEASIVLETLLRLPTFENIGLPFLPPLKIHDQAIPKSDKKNWIMVRMIEGFLELNQRGTAEKGISVKLGNVLTGNPDALITLNGKRTINNTDLELSGNRDGVFFHFCRNHIYAQVISDLVEEVNRNSNQEHWLFVEQTPWKAGTDSFEIDADKNPHTLFFNCTSKLDVGKLYQAVLSPAVDAVIMHGLFRKWEFNLINGLGGKKHIGWMIWGGDLYKPIKNGFPEKIPVNKISSIHSTVDGDRELFVRTYGEKAFFKLRYPYPGLYGDFIPNSKEQYPRIIVGNSGDASNNHIEILDILQQKKDIGNYEIHLPVAYNFEPKYEAELLEWIQNSNLKDKVKFKKEFLQPEEYIRFIDESYMLITAHQRQQSVGNMLMAIYTGKKTVLRNRIELNGETITNPTWEFLKNMGLEVASFEKLKEVETLRDFGIVEEEVKFNNQEIISLNFGIKTAAEELAKVAEQFRLLCKT
ncbi:MAG: TDP-N-acetylfucosamine:lipid II N-acetylfucosaminyltransferase [Balneolales bacterium]|nr:TDP-N-acetylfucosamine:lipid II N-acetylfucosaminyltransferase [Balneolales bacterium]